MKVLLVAPLPPPYGGVAHWTKLVLNHATASESPLSLTVLNTAPNKRTALEVSIFRRIREGIRRMITDNTRLVYTLLSKRPDIVHVNTSGQLAFYRDYAMSLILGMCRTPFVYHLHFGRLPEIYNQGGWEWKIAARVLSRAAVVLALDPRTVDTLTASRICHRVEYLPNPIPDRQAVAVSNLPRRKAALYVGWVIPAKGIGELLEAWASVSHLGWVLDIVGPGDATYLKSLREKGLPPGVTLVGALQNAEVIEKMRRSSIFVYPSHSEGFPNAVLEAMASGLAIVASDVGAIGDMLSGGAGRVVRAQDSDALAGELRSLMCADTSTDAMRTKAMHRVRDKYVMSVVFQEYVKLWKSL